MPHQIQPQVQQMNMYPQQVPQMQQQQQQQQPQQLQQQPQQQQPPQQQMQQPPQQLQSPPQQNVAPQQQQMWMLNPQPGVSPAPLQPDVTSPTQNHPASYPVSPVSVGLGGVPNVPIQSLPMQPQQPPQIQHQQPQQLQPRYYNSPPNQGIDNGNMAQVAMSNPMPQQQMQPQMHQPQQMPQQIPPQQHQYQQGMPIAGMPATSPPTSPHVACNIPAQPPQQVTSPGGGNPNPGLPPRPHGFLSVSSPNSVLMGSNPHTQGVITPSKGVRIAFPPHTTASPMSASPGCPPSLGGSLSLGGSGKITLPPLDDSDDDEYSNDDLDHYIMDGTGVVENADAEGEGEDDDEYPDEQQELPGDVIRAAAAAMIVKRPGAVDVSHHEEAEGDSPTAGKKKSRRSGRRRRLDQQRFKTVQCRNFNKNGCAFGNACAFAHGDSEIVPEQEGGDGGSGGSAAGGNDTPPADNGPNPSALAALKV